MFKKKAKTEKILSNEKNKSEIVRKVLSGINIDRLSNNPVKLTKSDIKSIIESNLKLDNKHKFITKQVYIDN